MQNGPQLKAMVLCLVTWNRDIIRMLVTEDVFCPWRRKGFRFGGNGAGHGARAFARPGQHGHDLSAHLGKECAHSLWNN